MPEVTYLGYVPHQGKHLLSGSRVNAVLQIPVPDTRRKLCEFWGTVGYCRLWIPRFTELARPLYEATKGKEGLLLWTEVEEGAFQTLKQALVSSPALALPDMTKPFLLFVDE